MKNLNPTSTPPIVSGLLVLSRIIIFYILHSWLREEVTLVENNEGNNLILALEFPKSRIQGKQIAHVIKMYLL